MNLDIPYDSPVYTIGESTQYSRIGELEDKVDTLTYKGQTYTGGGGSGVYIIRTNDSTPASDSNVFSALRSLTTFLRKDKPDVAGFDITFEQELFYPARNPPSTQTVMRAASAMRTGSACSPTARHG